MYDFIIIGGGPSGATLARLIGDRFSVLIIEKSGENTGEKLCGGLIAPDAQRMLGKFGLSLPSDVLVSPQMFYVDAHDLRTRRSQKYQRHYLNVKRKAFDNWLLSLLPRQVEVVRDTTYLRHDCRAGTIIVQAKSQGKTRTFEGRYLVGADGGHSPVRRKTFNDFKTITKYVSIQSEIDSPVKHECFKVFFHRDMTDFYGWMIPKQKTLHLGIALKGPRINEKYERFLEAVLESGAREIKRQSCVILRPQKNADFATDYQNNVFLIGEAAGFISPSSAEGFSFAFKSAECLAGAILQGKNIGRRYRRLTRGIKRELFLKRLKSLVMYNEYLRNKVFSLGINKL